MMDNTTYVCMVIFAITTALLLAFSIYVTISTERQREKEKAICISYAKSLVKTAWEIEKAKERRRKERYAFRSEAEKPKTKKRIKDFTIGEANELCRKRFDEEKRHMCEGCPFGADDTFACLVDPGLSDVQLEREVEL